MMGVELVADRKTKARLPASAKVAGRVAMAARRHGVLVRGLPNSDIVALSPPFIVTLEEIGLIAGGLRKAIDDVTRELRSEGLI